MEELVLLGNPPQNRNGILGRRLVNVNGLKAARQRRVFLDVLLVLFERGSANNPYLTPREGRFEHVTRVKRAIGLASTNNGMQLINKENNTAFSRLDFFHHGLEALFKLTTKFGARYEQAEVERENLFLLDAFRYLPLDNGLGEPFGNRCLPYTRFANQDRVVLGTARENLDDALHFNIATNYGVEFVLLRQLGEVAGKFTECPVLLWLLDVSNVVFANLL